MSNQMKQMRAAEAARKKMLEGFEEYRQAMQMVISGVTIRRLAEDDYLMKFLYEIRSTKNDTP